MNGDALGTSDVFLSFQEELTRLADSERPVLVLGERGTGKELAARRLHFLSRRWERPFVTVLCPGLSPTLLESEIFGHEAGAFTGARARRPGRFELADGGTLFLDEVGDMPLALQDKLLRVIEYGTFERVGGTITLRPDVRIVAATNQDLPRLAEEGRFRPDLLDRLSFEVAHAPPLRLRGNDVVVLAAHFVASLAMERELPVPGLAPEQLFGPRALGQLREHAWPGNVRELKNAVERSLLRQGSLPIPLLALDPFRPGWETEREDAAPGPGASAVCAPHQVNPYPANPYLPDWLEEGFQLSQATERLEREALEKALSQARYRQTGAARLLGLTYHQFRALYRKHRPGSGRDS